MREKREFYRVISTLISSHRDELHGLESSEVELVDERHPAIQGLSVMLQMGGVGSAHLSGNRLNGYFLPEGIVIRLML
jgi:hypothetical protein